MDMYEVQLCRQGRWEQQRWRVVAARTQEETEEETEEEVAYR